jgi:hypothetical protein
VAGAPLILFIAFSSLIGEFYHDVFFEEVARYREAWCPHLLAIGILFLWSVGVHVLHWRRKRKVPLPFPPTSDRSSKA